MAMDKLNHKLSQSSIRILSGYLLICEFNQTRARKFGLFSADMTTRAKFADIVISAASVALVEIEVIVVEVVVV